MRYGIEKYKIYHNDNKVVAVSSYAGRKVRGVAKCDPRDEFDLEKGKELAAARCNEKIAIKRLKRARVKMMKAHQDLDRALAYDNAMENYYNDALADVVEAKEVLSGIISKI